MVNFILVKMCFLHFLYLFIISNVSYPFLGFFFNDFCLGLSDAYFFVEWSQNPT